MISVSLSRRRDRQRLAAVGAFWLALLLPALGVELKQVDEKLMFVRLPDLAAAVPTPTEPTIIDLRYARLPAEADWAALQRVVREPGPLRLVLLDHAPEQRLLALLTQRDARVLTVGPAGLVPKPDVTVPVEAAADRAAYDVLQQSGDLASVADPEVSKRRFDEAALVKAQAAGGGRAAAASAAPEVSASKTGEPPAAPTDHLLQHAVRVARGLQALGRT